MRKSYAKYRGGPDDWPRGDCLRACVASVLDRETTEVPHFAGVLKDDTNDDMWRYFNQWAEAHRIAVYEMIINTQYTTFRPMSRHLDDIQEHLYEYFSGWSLSPLILTGSSLDQTHCVVYQGGKIIHDPSMKKGHGITGPNESGDFSLLYLRER